MVEVYKGRKLCWTGLVENVEAGCQAKVLGYSPPWER